MGTGDKGALSCIMSSFSIRGLVDVGFIRAGFLGDFLGDRRSGSLLIQFFTFLVGENGSELGDDGTACGEKPSPGAMVIGLLC